MAAGIVSAICNSTTYFVSCFSNLYYLMPAIN
jgi:hypothetical protein